MGFLLGVLALLESLLGVLALFEFLLGVLVLFEFCVGGVGFVTSFVYVIHYATTCSYFVSSHLRSPAVS